MNDTCDIRRGWEPPYITPHRHDNSKFGRRSLRDNSLRQIDGVDVEFLMNRFGSPLFIASERQLRQNARRLYEAFARHYHPVVHGWSYKTNYLSAICNILH
ncbi:MAG: diaminopimelate decarboxylase, partial [Magnetococcales bacterium]|nr:diaminopimelate decarboxylase [Magnetococcales bacterium]